MEKNLLLNAEIREHVGSKDAAKLRKQGKLPAVIYGHKKDPVAVSLDAHDTMECLHHGHRLADIKIGSKKETVIFKEFQYDHLGKNVIHVDLIRVDAKELVKVMVSIELKGIAAGTNEGGIIESHLDQIEVQCSVADIPEVIVIPVKDVNIGDSLHASDIKLPDGVKLVTAGDALLLTCHLVAAAKSTEELEEEGAVAPEVIGEKTKDSTEEKSS